MTLFCVHNATSPYITLSTTSWDRLLLQERKTEIDKSNFPSPRRVIKATARFQPKVLGFWGQCCVNWASLCPHFISSLVPQAQEEIP